MARLILLGLLVLTAAAAAAAAASSAPAADATFRTVLGTRCEPASLASKIGLNCAPDMPAAQCCGPLLAVVDLGGGVPCLCRATAQPTLVVAGLNASHLLKLYSSACGGAHSVGVDVDLPCKGTSHLSTIPSALPPSTDRVKHPIGGHFCDKAGELSLVVSTLCRSRQATEQCCTSLHAVMAGGGVVPCMCVLSNTTVMIDAGLTLRRLLSIYSSCGHIRPGDIHFPTTGCAVTVRAPPVATPPPKLSPAWTPPPKLSPAWTSPPNPTPVWTPSPPQYRATPATEDQKEKEIAKLESIVANNNILVVIVICLLVVLLVVAIAIPIVLFLAGRQQNRGQARVEEEAQILPPAEVDPPAEADVRQILRAAEAEDLEAPPQQPRMPARKKRKYDNIQPRRSEQLAFLQGQSSRSAS